MPMWREAKHQMCTRYNISSYFAHAHHPPTPRPGAETPRRPSPLSPAAPTEAPGSQPRWCSWLSAARRGSCTCSSLLLLLSDPSGLDWTLAGDRQTYIHACIILGAAWLYIFRLCDEDTASHRTIGVPTFSLRLLLSVI
ncbi:hypothetical protein K437DRAFT_34550 [Tilletiaria anomala UBC 951]|uniref:Uncharacterized protein n=1 Tax=Tilletiaria anomala (strain ATCC 24038 / CBS 436.72 / UBC 951) TaxID=1037660 RepID=A0A066WI30_TILAU|nr:uncharacterized protein K437DRAFT_34550 [Tilletiaria anomala UBC 951]KDN52188.1 hypothetical protein K437DRAFT_34550 [Tilletiaria anomala UBC 951]